LVTQTASDQGPGNCLDDPETCKFPIINSLPWCGRRPDDLKNRLRPRRECGPNIVTMKPYEQRPEGALGGANPARERRRGLSWAAAAVAVAVLIIVGCVALPELEQAKQLEGLDRDKKVEAVQLYESALRKVSGSKKLEVTAKISALKKEIVTSATQAAQQALGAAPTVPSAKAAVSLLDKYTAYDDEEKRLAAALGEHRQKLTQLQAAFASKVNDANTAQAGKKWNQAYALLQEAKAIDPSDTTIDQKIAQLLKARNDYFAGAIRSALKDEQVATAKLLLIDLSEQKPMPEASWYNALREEGMRGCDAITVRMVSDEVSKGKFYTAFRDLDLLYDKQAVTNREDLVRRGVAYYLQRAKEELANARADIEQSKGGKLAPTNRMGYAYFAIIKAREMDKSDSVIKKLHQDCMDLMEKLITVKIAVEAFTSPKEEPMAGPEFSGSLISRLVGGSAQERLLPYGINVSEVQKLDTGTADRTLAKIADELGLEMIVRGSVNQLQVTTVDNPQQNTVSIVTGTKTVTNPIWQQYLITYGPKVEKWPKPVPPPTVQEPTTEVRTYKSGKKRIDALMRITCKVFDTASDKVDASQDFPKPPKEAIQSLEGEYCEGMPLATPPVPKKELNLESELQIRERLRNERVSEVADWVLQQYSSREARYLRTANKYSKLVREKAKKLIPEAASGDDREESERAVLALAQGHYYCSRELDAKRLKGGEANEYYSMLSLLGLFETTE